MSDLPTDTALARIVERMGGHESDLWRSVHENMSEGLILVTPERRLVYANRAAGRLLQVPREEAVGQVCTDVFDCPQCRCVCRLFGEGGVEDVEVTLFNPSERVMRKNARLLRGTDGEILGGVETFVDVTKETRAVADSTQGAVALAAERRRNLTLARRVGQGLISIDADLRIQDVSDGAPDMLGIERGDMIGRRLDAVLSLPEGATMASLAEQRLAVHRPDGAALDLELELMTVRYGTAPLLGVLRPARAPAPEAEAIAAEHGYQGLIGQGPAMKSLFSLIEEVARSDVNVIVQGESGSGKELVARAIHDRGPRAHRPFFAVNCATFTGSLLLSELFGHERGAFTGAVQTRRGKLELADRGTLLLDEVSEIPLEHQALLLRVLEAREYERVGGTKTLSFEARVLAAANIELPEAVRGGRFRSDLFYRLNVVPIRIPPLRERPEDIALIARYFLARCATRGGRAAPRGFAPAALHALEAYPWPGNVRELKNMVEYLCFACRDEVKEADLPPHVRGRRSLKPVEPTAPDSAPTGDERARIVAALEAHKYRKAEAAAALGMNRSTLWRKMKRLGL